LIAFIDENVAMEVYCMGECMGGYIKFSKASYHNEAYYHPNVEGVF